MPFILHCDATTLVIGAGFIRGERNFKCIKRGERSAAIKVADGIKPDMIIIKFCYGVVPQFRFNIGKVLAAAVDGSAGRSVVAVAGPADWCAGPPVGPVGRQDAAAAGPTGRYAVPVAGTTGRSAAAAACPAGRCAVTGFADRLMTPVTDPTDRCAGAVTGPTGRFVTSIGCLSAGRCAAADECVVIVNDHMTVMTGLCGGCIVADSSLADGRAAAISDTGAVGRGVVSDAVLVVGRIVTGCSLVRRRAVTDVCPVSFSVGGPADLCAVLAAFCF